MFENREIQKIITPDMVHLEGTEIAYMYRVPFAALTVDDLTSLYLFVGEADQFLEQGLRNRTLSMTVNNLTYGFDHYLLGVNCTLDQLQRWQIDSDPTKSGAWEFYSLTTGKRTRPDFSRYVLRTQSGFWKPDERN